MKGTEGEEARGEMTQSLELFLSPSCDMGTNLTLLTSSSRRAAMARAGAKGFFSSISMYDFDNPTIQRVGHTSHSRARREHRPII
jgi:hypothetical protein